MLISVILSTVILFIVSEVLMFFLPNEMNIVTKMPERFAVVIEVTCLLCLIAVRSKKCNRLVRKNGEDRKKDIKRNIFYRKL